jgi:hypothetical protein
MSSETVQRRRGKEEIKTPYIVRDAGNEYDRLHVSDRNLERRAARKRRVRFIFSGERYRVEPRYACAANAHAHQIGMVAPRTLTRW